MKKITSLSCGFSLLELLVVLVIMTLTANIITYSISQHHQHQALQNASLNVMRFLINVQAQANWYNQSYIIHIEKIKNYWQITAMLFSHQQGRETIGKVTRRSAYLNEKELQRLDYTTISPIIFYGRRNMASTGHIRLSNSIGEIQIIVSARGRIRRCFRSRQGAAITMAEVPQCE